MKRIRVILGWLLAGAVVNVLVAWASASWIDGLAMDQRTKVTRGVDIDGTPGWSVAVHRRATVTIVSHSAYAYRSPVNPGPDASSAEVAVWLRERAAFEAGQPLPPRTDATIIDVPAWSRAATPPDLRVTRDKQFLDDARGWPRRSMASYFDTHFDRTTKTQATLVPDWRLDFGSEQGPLGLPRGLPLRPMPQGFIINTLFYAVIMWMSFAAWLLGRRIIRHRHGLCSCCAYDLRGTDHAACPECGMTVVTGGRT